MYESAQLISYKGKWRGQLKYKDGSKWRSISKVLSSKGKRDAQKELAAWRETMEVKTLEAEGKKPDQTVNDYLNAYVNEAAGSVEPSTVSGYRHLAHNVIGRYIGSVELCDLNPSKVARWQQDALEDYSAASVRKGLILLRAAMKQAVEREVLSKDPTRTVRPPKQASPKSNSLDERGRAAVLAFVNINPTSAVSVGIRIALYTGMREAELCALRWKNVNIDAGTLRVGESFGRAARGDAERYAVDPICFAGWYLKEPKNKGSIRTVCYSEALSAVLQERKSLMREECLAAGVPFNENMYVLGSIDQYNTTRSGKPALDYMPMHPHTLWKRWHSIAGDLELIGTEGKVPALHDLRHTYATTAIANGIDVKTVSSSMGHSDAAMTLNRYASADPDAQRRAAKKLEEIYSIEARNGSYLLDNANSQE